MRPDMLKLYYAPGTCALASHITLEEAGAAYTTERLDFKTNQQSSPEYLAINPKGLAPLDDPFAFAQVQAFNSYLCSTVHVAHAHKMRGYRWATEESSFADMKRMIPKTVGACFALIEQKMLKGPWVMGDGYTICDPYLFTIAQWLEGDGVDIASMPKVADHFKRMSERPAVRKVLEQQRT
jgi:glutathione S-transferase